MASGFGFLAGGLGQGFAAGANIGLQKRQMDILQKKQQSEEQLKLQEKQNAITSKYLKDIESIIDGIKESTPGPMVVSPEEQKQALLDKMEPIIRGQPMFASNPQALDLTMQTLRSRPTGYEVAQRDLKTKELESAATERGKQSEKPRDISDINNWYDPSSKRTVSRLDTDPNNQDAIDRGWVNIGKPQFDDPESLDLSTDKKTLRDFSAREIEVRNTVGMVDRIVEQVKSGKVFTSIAGSTAIGVNQLVGNIIQLTTIAHGVDATKDINLIDPDKYAGEFAAFGSEAAATRQFRSNVVGLAYALARAEDPGGRLSEMDVKNQLRRIASDSADPVVIEATLKELKRSVIRNYKNAFTVTNRYVGGKLGSFPDDLQGEKKQSSLSEFNATEQALIDKAVNTGTLSDHEIAQLSKEAKIYLMQQLRQ